MKYCYLNEFGVKMVSIKKVEVGCLNPNKEFIDFNTIDTFGSTAADLKILN